MLSKGELRLVDSVLASIMADCEKEMSESSSTQQSSEPVKSLDRSVVGPAHVLCNGS